jgi:plastocyanin
MRSIIVSTVLLLFLITNYNGLAVAIAQEEDFTISINPGATNSASQNPIAPENLTISKDTTVTWVNKDSTYHQIVSGNPDTGPSNIFYGDYFGPSESYNVTFDNAGIYQYYDPNWSHINGQITVEDVETTTETGTIENTSDMTSSIDQVSNETNVANEIKPNASMIDNIAPISSLLGSIASGENHTNQSSASALSTLSTDPTLDSIIDKVRPFFNLLSGENSLNGTLDSIISASNQTLEENPIPETNLSSIEPKLLSGENIDPVMNNSFSLQNSSTTISLEEEKVKVQKDLADSLRKAISIGIEIPEITGFDDDNATVYIKVNVINPIDRIANTSNFPIQINYDDIEGIPGVSMIFANEAGMIQKLPASAYNIVSAASQTGDQSLDALLNSYSSAYSEGCSGSISFMETKDCIITKEYSNMPMNNTTEKTN